MLTSAVGCSLVVILALWSADHSRKDRDAALQTANSLKIERDSLDARNRELAGVLADNAVLQDQINEITRISQQLNMSLDHQSSVNNRNLEELKRNDKKIADYMGSTVPTVLGLQYARPETTDPLAYRAGAVSVSSGPMSLTGSWSTDTQ